MFVSSSQAGVSLEFSTLSVAMSPGDSGHFAEAERAELERVLEAVTQPRLSRLLRYMGEKVLSGEADQLNEYNIATEVLGRPRTVFNSAGDAIARVETHRLRKRLAEYYEREGKDHPIRVTVPTGGYVPTFVHRRERTVTPSAGTPDVALVSQVASPAAGTQESHVSHVTPPDEAAAYSFRGSWKYIGLGAAVVLAVLAVYLYIHAERSATGVSVGMNPVTASASVSPPPGAASAPIRLLAGYSGAPRTDSAGRLWSPDQYFSAGGSWRRSPEFLARTSDPFIFDHWRTGDFSYNIPLKPGSYELHLFFSTQTRSEQAVSSFNIEINGQPMLIGFDINVDARGTNVADERVFRDISPDKDGVLRIRFSTGTGSPVVSAIEIVPGIPHAQLPVRLITQTAPLTDHKGQVWHPDDYFLEGRSSGPNPPLKDSPDPDLFAGERYGNFTYAIPVDTRDRYTLILHFAEFYFGSGLAGNGGAGSRVFKVMCNGETLLDNFDVFKEAGSLHELTKTFHHLKPSAQGKLNLTFEPIVNNATVSGIEVLDEAQ